MVVKQTPAAKRTTRMFESSVISYGSKTQKEKIYDVIEFESSVISYGSKTIMFVH